MSISTVLFTTALSLIVSIPALASIVEVPTPVSHILVPTGFTEADNALVILSGEFPNTCYEVAGYETEVDVEQKIITIDAKSTTETDAVCALRMVPFAQTVELGALEAGEYKIMLAGNPGLTARSLVIAPRTEEQPHYAAVRDASLEVSAEGQFLTLRGDYPFTFVGCAVVENIKVKQVDDKMLYVEPLLTFHTNNENCASWSPRFQLRYELTEPLPAGQVVLFVKTADGNDLVRIATIAR